jgi:hypothetical protein
LGQLFIAWGPGIETDPDFADVFKKHWAEGISLFFDYHAGAMNGDPDPFASQYFGVIARTLLAGTTVVVMDRTFDDPKRRRLTERALALSAGDHDIYTPNYVSAVTVDESGNPGFYIDCKGAIEPRMAYRFRQILVQELERAGVSSARVRVPD